MRNRPSAVMPTSHIQRSPAEIVDRPNVAEFQIRQGVRFLARREVGRAPFWICDGPCKLPNDRIANNRCTCYGQL